MVVQIKPVQGPDLERAAELLQSFNKLIGKTNPEELKRFLHAVLDEVSVKNKKVVAIRPKPNYYDLLCMSLADPTGNGYAGDIQILGPQDELARTI